MNPVYNLTTWRAFLIVFEKEFRELRRDRRTLFFLLAPPIILPAIALIGVFFIGTQTVHYMQQGFPIAVLNADRASSLVAVLRKSPALILVAPGDSAQVPLITLSVPDDFDATLDAGKTAKITLTQHDNTYVTTLALGAVRSEIGTYNQQVLEQRLHSTGHDQTWLTPVTVDETQPATAAQSVAAATAPKNAEGNNSSNLGALFLPLAVTSWLIGGGLGLIVDTTVGEKERQTIELVLVTPANRVGIVMGKLTVVFIASLVVMGLWMVEGLLLAMVADIAPKVSNGAADLTGIALQSGQATLGLLAVLLLLLIPFIIVLNSLVMAFCTFANSYRESNLFLFLLQLALPAMVLLSVFSVGPNAGIGWYGAPILGTIIAIRDLFSQTLNVGGLVLSVVSTSLYAVVSLALASYIYSRDWTHVR
jgi:sodium transport system permease protein